MWKTRYLVFGIFGSLLLDMCKISITAGFLQGTQFPTQTAINGLKISSQHNDVLSIIQFPIHFYELRYDFTVYEQFFYDVLNVLLKTTNFLSLISRTAKS